MNICEGYLSNPKKVFLLSSRKKEISIDAEKTLCQISIRFFSPAGGKRTDSKTSSVLNNQVDGNIIRLSDLIVRKSAMS